MYWMLLGIGFLNLLVGLYVVQVSKENADEETGKIEKTEEEKGQFLTQTLQGYFIISAGLVLIAFCLYRLFYK